MTTDTRISELIINKLTKAQYDAAVAAGTISETELYAVTDDDTYVDMETFTNALANYTTTANLAAVALSGEYADLLNKPTISTVGSTGEYSDLLNKPTIDQTYNGTSTNAQSGTAVAGLIANYSRTDAFSNVAFSGDFADLTNVPAAATVDQVYNGSSTNAQSGTAVAGLIANYMTSNEVNTAISNAISTVYKYKGSVATYADLPSSDQQVGDVWNVESDGHNYAWTGTEWDRLAGTVDLSNYVTLNTAQTITNKTINLADNTVIGLSAVATSGEYADLLNKPTIDQTFNGSSANAQSGVAIEGLIANYTTTANLASVALSGEYADLLNKPTISTVGSTGEYDDLLNKPTFANVAFSGDFADLTNVPASPTVDQVYNASSTNAQSGTAVAGAIADMQTITNMVDVVSNTSTNTTYPTASAVYNSIANLSGVVFREWSN